MPVLIFLCIILSNWHSSIDVGVENGEIVANVTRFKPEPALLRTDADLTLMYLTANKIIYTGKVNDPWFRNQGIRYSNGSVWELYCIPRR